MRKTTNYGLALYDKEDKMNITSEENSLNHNMVLIDSALKEKATETFVTNKIAEAELSGGEVDLSGYATKDDLKSKADKTELHTHSNKEILDSITQDDINNWNNGTGGTGKDTNTFQELYTRYEPINPKIFEGKKLWVFGDSITAGVGTDAQHYFSQLLADKLGCTLTRKGNSGYAFTHGINDYGSCVLNIIDSQLATAPGNCDILIICFGVNDWTWGRNIEGDRAIGELWDTTKYTICGAVNLFCQKLQTIFADYPDVKIYFSTPTPTKNAPISGGNTEKTWDQTKQNYNGNTLRDICNAIIKVAASYGYRSLDLNLYFDGDINDTTNMDTYFPDGLHPSAEGNVKMANTLEKLLIANPITTFTFNPLVTKLDVTAKELIYREKIEGEEPEIETYTVTYNINGHGEQPSPVSGVTSLPNTLPVLAEEGYNFGGWYVDSSLTTLAVTGTTINSDITLYAKWTVVEENVEAIAPTITTQPIGGTYEVGSEINPLTIVATTSDGGLLTYQWYKDEEILESQTSQSYLPDVNVVGTSTYYCIVTNTLNGTTATTKSNTVSVIIEEEQPIAPAEVIDLDTLTLAHANLTNATGECLSYNQETHELTANSADWYKTSYFTTPVRVGYEIELDCNFSNIDGTTGNFVGLYTKELLDNPKIIANSFWVGTDVFGLYCDGSGTHKKAQQWDSSKLNFEEVTAGSLNDKTLKLKLTNEGVELYIDDVQYALAHDVTLDSSKDYYIGMNFNAGNVSSYGATVQYIGPIRTDTGA